MSNYQSALKTFQEGGIVIFPTDTAYGIGCRMDNTRAVRGVFKIRNRPEEKAVLILVADRKMAQKYLKPFTSEAKRLVSRYWPGPVTFVQKCKTSKVPSVVRGGGDTLGVRIPKHVTIRRLIKELGVPIVAPSANMSGGKTPFYLWEVSEDLKEKVDYVMPGQCTYKKASTVVDISEMPFKVLRKGAVRLDI